MGTPIPYKTVIQFWPPGAPLLCLGGPGWDAIIATAIEEIPWEALESQSFLLSENPEPLLTYTLGIIPYDPFCRSSSNAAPPRFFRICELIRYDLASQSFRVEGSFDTNSCDFILDRQVLGGLVQALNHGPNGALKVGVSPVLRPAFSQEYYLAQARQVLENIREGRFYQLNLLRYFMSLEVPKDMDLALRMDAFGGPMSAWISVPHLKLISFSPERFVDAKINDADDSLAWIETCPIKGTAARSSDPEVDSRLRLSLKLSEKNRAELAMIVDLMRNDLARISMPRSVVVDDPGSVCSFSQVHHLVAKLRSLVDRDVSLRFFLETLCPAGSITGAPKKEVIKTIRAYEKRDRRYFMGHIMVWNGVGRLNSSILIRTAVSEGQNGVMEYAAGSGLVMHSDPAEELAEIATKLRVFADSVLDF